MKETIGIEVHVELKSKEKVFSNSLNNFNDEPNKNVSLIDIAYPGTLPKLNKEVVNMALKAALALNCKINKHMHFDRKNYFYPDLPKGYQITQKDTPIGYDGYVEIMVGDEIKKIEIERIHIEEDTCKSIHVNNETLLNYNRAGVPLVEIVTKPVIKSSKEAVLYLEALREQLLYLGISDVKIEEGSMRCDANVSISDTDILGTKTEIKNIGSITNVGISIEYEINRQKELLEKGIKINEETRRFDDKTNTTILMRTKETGNDYRYFPEPDLSYVLLDEKDIEEVKNSLPELPNSLRKKYHLLKINENNIKTIIANKEICDFFETLENCNKVIASNLLTGDILNNLNKEHLTIRTSKMSKEAFVELVELLDSDKISSKQCKEIIPVIIIESIMPNEVMKRLGIELITDNSFLEGIINKVLETNHDSIKDYKEGKDRAIKYLMGQIMKESKGKINPKAAMDSLISKLNNL